jgi:glycogen debranching enzyme
LSKISEVTGYKEDALHFEEQSLRISRAMRDRMMEDDLFWSTHGENYEKIKVKTWAIFAPLFANILSKEEARKLVDEHLFNDSEFKTSFGVPTVSINEESYDPNGFWRGPVWIATNWFVYHGLLNYGMKKEADIILQHSLNLLEQSGFREYFNPETGEGLGAENFTWGALIIDMIENT